ncbi:hypothetical protein DUNSADRAFT_4912 [Dunaliella salina]|uniref:Uncharacterized protein n=1 Tax=Dunaliella salina TaxID=3046 RepID=A0ABQ7GR35_DUNSA|nr:hypothetical protein DUNSADRAFT_4912 [Dunaliella salina]|eukprot:KAF5837032.1 hypothetical protein DUNSADRAFT_4912 [Dunaliella salina]
MGLWRVRAGSFLAGFGICAGLALYQIRQEIKESHEVVSSQANEYRSKLEKRVSALEKELADMRHHVPQPQQ